MFLSPGANSQPSWALMVWATMLAWDSITPLGRPVVPEEYMTRQTSSGETSSGRVDPLGGLQPRFVLVTGRAVGGDLDDLLDVGEVLADLVDRRHQLGAHDEHLGAGVVDRVVDLVAGRAPVDDRVGRAERPGGHGELDARRVVLVEEGDHVAAADAECLQPAGAAADPVLPLPPGPGPLAIGERRPVGQVLGPVREPVVDVVRCRSGHAGLWLPAHGGHKALSRPTPRARSRSRRRPRASAGSG